MILTIEAPDRDCEDHAVGQHKVCAATVHMSCATLDVLPPALGPCYDTCVCTAVQ